METWCMEHLCMTFFLVTLFILSLVDISANIARGVNGRNLRPDEKQSTGEGVQK